MKIGDARNILPEAESKANRCSITAHHSSTNNDQLRTGMTQQTRISYIEPCDVTFNVTCSPMTSISYRRLEARSTNTSSGLVPVMHKTHMYVRLCLIGLWKTCKCHLKRTVSIRRLCFTGKMYLWFSNYKNQIGTQSNDPQPENNSHSHSHWINSLLCPPY